MARQLSFIETRTSQERYGTDNEMAQSIRSIFQTIGQAEKVRRDRQTLDRVTRAIAGGKTTIQAIADAAMEGPDFSAGLRGALQRFGGMFQPPGGAGQDIQQSIIGGALQQALAPPTATSGNRISSLLRAAEISERQSKTAPSAGLAQRYRELATGFIEQAMNLLLPTDTSEATEKQRKRASKIDRRIQDETPRTGVVPTAKDLEKYGRMGVKGYVSPSGKKYPLTKPVTSSEFKALPPGKRLTIMELSPIFEKAQKNGIKRLDLYREAAKLKGLGLSREEMLTALDKLAEGATAEQLIEFLKTQPEPWKAP